MGLAYPLPLSFRGSTHDAALCAWGSVMLLEVTQGSPSPECQLEYIKVLQSHSIGAAAFPSLGQQSLKESGHDIDEQMGRQSSGQGDAGH